MTDPRKPAFAGVIEAFRAAGLPNPFNDSGNMHALHNLLDAWGLPRERKPARTISPAGIALIKQFEGCKLTAYPDPGSGGEPWTIGWGATMIDGRPVKRGQTITQAQADALLMADIERHARDVVKVLGDAPTTQHQFDALVSFHFNTGAIGRATLTEKHKAGAFNGAAAEFARWNKAAGRVMAGLTRRRAAEAKLYRGQVRSLGFDDGGGTGNGPPP